jgi:hypothetical protein
MNVPNKLDIFIKNLLQQRNIFLQNIIVTIIDSIAIRLGLSFALLSSNPNLVVDQTAQLT